MNILTDLLPSVDLILCRDCLVHFSSTDVFKAIENMVRSGSKYLLTTTFVHRTANHDIVTGLWRPLNLEVSPFGFPKPLFLIDEHCTEGGGTYADKSLGLWKLGDLQILDR